MIRVEHLIFDYPGHRALDDVSFEIKPGTITALVGPNGAGKSTLMRVCSGLERPFAGRVRLQDIDVHESPREAHGRMGYLADFFGLYD
jgi:ABC-2 type transport system ATP-binding protein